MACNSASVGWISFQITFNSLNTLVYGLLFPLLLENNYKNYSGAFSLATTLTTILTALLLPVWGVYDDVHGTSGLSERITAMTGVLLTAAIAPAFWLDLPSAVIYALYVLAIFALRTGVMNNNTLLGAFQKEQRTSLSSIGNFIGFSLNLGGLLLLYNAESLMTKEVWVLCFSGLAFLAWVVTMLCPDPVKRDIYDEVRGEEGVEGHDDQYQDIPDTVIERLKRMWSSLQSDAMRPALWFLLAYMFFSTGGTVITVFLSVFFLDSGSCQDNDDKCATQVNLYFKMAMIAGTVIGMVADRQISKNGVRTPQLQHEQDMDDASLLTDTTISTQDIKSSLLTIDRRDLRLLWLQCTWYGISYIGLFLAVLNKTSFDILLGFCLSIGTCYGWNVSLARSVMSKLSPIDQQAEIMGFYSSVTYISIAAVSGIMSIMASLDINTICLPIVVLICMAPCVIFLCKF